MGTYQDSAFSAMVLVEFQHFFKWELTYHITRVTAYQNHIW